MIKLLLKATILTLLIISQANGFAQKQSIDPAANLNIPPMEVYYPFDDGIGDIVTEKIKGLNGVLKINQDIAETPWISSKLGGALHLDGDNDRVLVPHNPAFDFSTEDFSVSFFMRWRKDEKPHSQHIMCKGDYHSASPYQTGKRWEMYMSGGGFCFIIDDDVNKSQLRVPLDLFISGDWVHVVAVRDTKNKQLKLYGNGRLLESTDPERPELNGVDITGDISNPQAFTIGDSYLQDNPLPGDLDDLRIFRTVLTEQQIIDLAKLMVEVKPLASEVKQDMSKIDLIPDFAQRPRIIVTSDGEIDDQCSMIRFMLYTNENDIEGIITSSSQYHWRGHKWAGDNWIDPDLEAYEKVYPNLIKHDPNYPTPEYLRSITLLGNVDDEGEMEKITEGSQHIVKVLLDETDHNPIWLQAWGGTNTIARALKTIEEDYPEKMAYVAKKMRFFFIWEQDVTYQEYIRPVWGKFNIPTIISDQFEAIAYRWKMVQPEEMLPYFEGPWMKENILENHGPLCAIYAAHEEGKSKGFNDGDFRSEGDSPAFIHTIVTGLRNRENPSWGGWGGRYVRVRENTYLDPVPVKGYGYPSGRWSGNTGWGRGSLRETTTSTPEQRKEYFKPMWRWSDVLQNDFAARADWCVMSYEEANHPPVVVLNNKLDLMALPGETITLSAEGSTDPDGDKLKFIWWQHQEADTYKGTIEIKGSNKKVASFVVPADAKAGNTIHVICEVKDNGEPQLTRYQRVVIEIKNTQTVQKPDSAVGMPPMTAHFPLNKDANDVINGLKGKLVNGDPNIAWTKDGIDGAVELDGMDDYIVVPHNPALDFGDESFSISFWMRWPKDLPISHERIITKGDYESSYPGEKGVRYELFVASGNLAFILDDDKNKSQIQVSMAPFTTGEWVHVAAVRDARNKKAKRLKLYANGILQKTSSPGNPGKDGLDITGSVSNTREFLLGEASRYDAPYQGRFDDLRLYRDVLTDEQVVALATKAEMYTVEPVVELKEVKKKRYPAIFDEKTTLPPMEAHFTFDETSGSKIKDEVTGLVGEIKDAEESDWVQGISGGALRFDGKDNRVFVPNNPAYNFDNEGFSVSFLMRWPKERIARHEHMISKGDYASAALDETGKRWEIIMAGGKGLCFNIDDDVNKSQILAPFDDITTGEWVHIVCVRDTKDKLLKVYANGVLQESPMPESVHYDGIDRTTSSISNPQQLIIGDSKRLDNPFAGELDDIRIYRKSLSGPQVAKLAFSYGLIEENSGSAIPPMEAHWPMDDKSGTTVVETVNGINGTLINADPATVWGKGKVVGSLQLDGKDDHVVVPNNPAVDFTDEAFSVTFFIRWPKENISGHQHFINKGDYNSTKPNETGKRWEVTTFPGKGVTFIVDDDINKSAIVVPFDAFATGEWVHVAAVRDVENKQLVLYANGIAQKSINPNDPLADGVDRTGSVSNNRDLHIGYSGYNDNPFKGDLDDVRLFRVALTNQQVNKIAGIEESFDDLPPMEAHWTLDDKSGDIVKEEIKGLDGKLNNANLSTAGIDGKVGGAVKFDGLDDRIIVPTNPAFDFSDEDFSVAFFMRWPKEETPHHEHFLTKGDYNSSETNQTGKRWEICNDGSKGICFNIDDDVNKSNILVAYDAFMTGEWVHVVAVRDTKNRILKLYADGILQEALMPDNPKFDGVDRTGSIENPQSLFIGDASLQDNPLIGDLDDIRIYRSALSDEQVVNLVNQLK